MQIAIKRCISSLKDEFPKVGSRRVFYTALQNQIMQSMPYRGNNASIRRICEDVASTLSSLPRWAIMSDIRDDLFQFAKREIAYAMKVAVVCSYYC